MNYIRNIGRGQASLMAMVVTAGITVVGSVFTAWATASGTANEKISDVRTEVRVIAERENNHYAEVQKQLTEISSKLDTALGLKSKQTSQR